MTVGFFSLNIPKLKNSIYIKFHQLYFKKINNLIFKEKKLT